MNHLFIRGARLQPDRPEPRGERYAFDLPAVRHIDRIRFEQPVTFLVGENGMGKSTILEALAVAAGLNAEGGSANFHFSSQDTHGPLGGYLTLIRGPRRPQDGFFLRAESFYNVATEVDRLQQEAPGDLLRSYGGRSLHAQSHGESFMALMLNRFRGGGLYLLDEPEAALSPQRQLAMLCRMDQLAREGAQMIIATHSPILMAYPRADIYVLEEAGPIKTPYEQTEHVRVTKAFLNNPQGMLRVLLEEEPLP